MEEQGMSNLMNQEMSPELQSAYQQSQELSRQGMDAASIQLARQEQARNINAITSAAKGKRSFLASAPGLYQSSGDFALRLAADNAMIRRQNQMAGIQTGMNYGQQAMALQQMKNEALINRGVAKRNTLNQTLTSGLTAGANIGMALLGKPPGV
jgi:hypothetical protein